MIIRYSEYILPSVMIQNCGFPNFLPSYQTRKRIETEGHPARQFNSAVYLQFS
jgi:hypothetical protein